MAEADGGALWTIFEPPCLLLPHSSFQRGSGFATERSPEPRSTTVPTETGEHGGVGQRAERLSATNPGPLTVFYPT